MNFRRNSPPLTPTPGCSLADKMTRTIPMMNHSLRSLARRPMIQLRRPHRRPPLPALPAVLSPKMNKKVSSTPPLRFFVVQRENTSGASRRATSVYVISSATVMIRGETRDGFLNYRNVHKTNKFLLHFSNTTEY